MSDTPSAGGSPASELQFDQVEYTAPVPAAACKICGQPMQSVYYEVNGQPFCHGCSQQLQKALTGGSAVGRFARATLYGSLAGLAGAAIYYGVREMTGHEFGLISILVGLAVGKSVRKGSGGRGGWCYQGLAMLLTYTAIVLTFIPPMLQAIGNQMAEAAAAKAEQAANPDGVATAGDADETDVADAPADVAAPADAAAQPRPSMGQLLLALAFLAGLAFAIPVLAGIHSPMGLIIIAIGLYEAWVTNRRVTLVINGPYQIGRADAGSAAHVEPAG